MLQIGQYNYLFNNTKRITAIDDILKLYKLHGDKYDFQDFKSALQDVLNDEFNTSDSFDSILCDGKYHDLEQKKHLDCTVNVKKDKTYTITFTDYKKQKINVQNFTNLKEKLNTCYLKVKKVQNRNRLTFDELKDLIQLHDITPD